MDPPLEEPLTPWPFAADIPVPSSSSATPSSTDIESPRSSVKEDKGSKVARAEVLDGKRKSFSSCDACRMRKIKCNKAAEDAACEGCSSKNIACTFVFKKEMSGKTKRIQQAKQVFGSTDDYRAAASTINRRPMSSRSFDGVEVQPAYLPRLLHTFKEQIWIIVPTTNFSRLLNVCEDSHYDIRLMDSMDRLLCIAAAATALRVEVGQRGPGSNFSLVASGSADATDVLVARALELVDAEGMLREPSVRGLEILRLLMMLTSEENARTGQHGNNYRSFQSTYVEHLRILVEKDQLGRDQIAAFFLSLIVNDSFASAISGRIPAFTDDDIENLAFFMESDTISLLNHITTGVPGDPSVGYDIIFGPLCLLARSFYSRITSSRARKRKRIDLEFLEEVPGEIDRVRHILTVYEQKLLEIFGSTAQVPPQFHRMSSMVRFMFSIMLCLAMDELEDATVRELTAELDLHRLQALQQTFRKLQENFVASMRNTSSPFKIDNNARAFAVVDGLLAYASMKRLRRILKCPTVEEVGPTDGLWTNQEKVTALNFFMYIANGLAGYVPSVREDLPAIAQEVNTYIENVMLSMSNPACPSKSASGLDELDTRRHTYVDETVGGEKPYNTSLEPQLQELYGWKD